MKGYDDRERERGHHIICSCCCLTCPGETQRESTVFKRELRSGKFPTIYHPIGNKTGIIFTVLEDVITRLK